VGGVQGGDGAEGGAVGGQGCGEAGRVEAGGGGVVVLVDDAEVAEVVEHLDLRGRQGRFAVVLAELEAAEHEEEGEDVDGVHVQLDGMGSVRMRAHSSGSEFRATRTHRLGVLEIQNEDGPHLRVDFL